MNDKRKREIETLARAIIRYLDWRDENAKRKHTEKKKAIAANLRRKTLPDDSTETGRYR